MLQAALALSIIWGSVVAEQGLDCPDPEAVAARLKPLLPRAADGSEDTAHLAREGDALVITFRRADGSYAGRRAVVGPHPCDELAEAAAVIIASWQLDPDTSERAPALPAAESSTASSLATRTTAWRSTRTGPPVR